MKTEQALYNMQGNSMYPVLKAGDLGLVKCISENDVRLGDIVVFQQNGVRIAHRLVKKTTTDAGTLFIAKGDKNKLEDPPFEASDVEGVLTAYYRKGMLNSFNTPYQRIERYASLNMPGFAYYVRNVRFKIWYRSKWVKTHWTNSLANFRRILSTSHRLFAVNAVLAILQGVAPLLLIVCIKAFIDTLTQPEGVARGSMGATEWLWLVATACLFFFIGALRLVGNYYTNKLSIQLDQHAHRLLHDKHANLGLSYYESPEQQDLMHRAVQEAGFRPVKIVMEALTLIRSVAALCLVCALFLSIKWYVVLLLIAAVLPDVWVNLRQARKRYALKQAQSTDERKMQYVNRILTGEAFAKEIRLFQLFGVFHTRYTVLEKRLDTEKQALNRAEVTCGLVTQSIAFVALLLTLVLVVSLLLSGSISIGSVVLYLFVFQRGYAVLGDCFHALTRLAEDHVFLNDFTRFLDVPEAERKAATSVIPPLKQTMRVENLHFRYPGTSKEVLKGINLVVPAGQTIALVGPNGSGKTTLLKLLCRFYDPTSGRILLDENDLETLDKVALRETITAVFQDFALYNLSAGENIGMGNVKQPIDAQHIRFAAQQAGVADLLEGLPDGYETQLGHLFRNSRDLSIGQWQKIAIARAFYRDAPLLFMDEPSSALDATSEKQLLEALRQLGKNKTVIIVSHRLSTVQWADRIVVLDKGLVVEEGTHTSLLAAKGLYHTLYNNHHAESDVV